MNTQNILTIMMAVEAVKSTDTSIRSVFNYKNGESIATAGITDVAFFRDGKCYAVIDLNNLAPNMVLREIVEQLTEVKLI